MKAPLFEETLPGGAMWSMIIPRRRLVRLTALDVGANLSALLYNARQPLDRLNIPDTLKALHTAKLTRGHILMSDMGHALASIVEDTLGWHDPLGGHSTAEHIRAKYGEHGYQDYRNDWYRNAHDHFLVELGKHGLGLRDIVANVNFFSKVAVDDDGRLHFVADHCSSGTAVTLRTEMDVLLVLSNTPHPLAPAGKYPRAAVKIEIEPADPPDADDLCRNFRPECARTLALTQRLSI
ncbi:MAG: urea carboxylase-associated family protein [Terrimicrobiaceae bacterium]|nr:urea carboxylase-associated family protein [Terrimicrobiaceae bacterium]